MEAEALTQPTLGSRAGEHGSGTQSPAFDTQLRAAPRLGLSAIQGLQAEEEGESQRSAARSTLPGQGHGQQRGE